jgi:hypothetical protein
MLWLIYDKRPEKVNVKLFEHYFEKVHSKVIKENLNKMVIILIYFRLKSMKIFYYDQMMVMISSMSSIQK